MLEIGVCDLDCEDFVMTVCRESPELLYIFLIRL